MKAPAPPIVVVAAVVCAVTGDGIAVAKDPKDGITLTVGKAIGAVPVVDVVVVSAPVDVVVTGSGSGLARLATGRLANPASLKFNASTATGTSDVMVSKPVWLLSGLI